MKINYTKTKEMILGPLARQPPQPLSDGSGSECVLIERVYHFKLLGINISHDMNWQAHIDAISHKASSRLHFLRILKKSGLKPHHLLHFYLTGIRPVLEYCSVVWHHSRTKAQSGTLEAIQRWALRIIYPPTTGLPYTFALTLPKLPSLSDRREHINRQLFRSISSSCISSLLPIPRNHDVTSRLRAASLYPHPVTRTKQYTSFINYSLLHYQ